MLARALLSIALLACLSACAFSEETVDVPYTPTQAGPVASAGALSLAVTDGRTSNRARISVKLNGYDVGGAPIRSARPVTDIVHDALVQEFSERGFRLGQGTRGVNVTVERFYNTYGLGVFSGTETGDAQLLVSVVEGSRTVFQQAYAGQYNAPVLITAGNNAAASVSKALQDAIGQMFADPGFVSAVTAQTAGNG